jgi:predicted dehydrogenase
MIAETEPDCVIVTTKDCHHDEYICRAMELGCDAITEKPLTTDEQKLQRIVDTRRETGRKCTVTFNYRYSPSRTQVKDMLMAGAIGNVLSVDFNWLLDTSHGADYFRRWHRSKSNSGGLMVHKATHHFDLVNWSLSAVPVSVFARGDRKFYTPEQADRYGLTDRSERCLDCRESGKCPFYLDLRSYEGLRELYLENEQYDGYFRDQCVFSDRIDIEDTMHLVVAYDSGATMSYSLNAFMPWEGMSISFSGSKGRLESVNRESVYISGDGSVPGEFLAEGTTLRLFPHFQPPRELEVWRGEGGHGGGDVRLLDDIFSPDPPEDKYMHAADHRAGAYSILTGIAANRSFETGKEILIADLVHALERPDFPPMPSPDEPIPLGDREGRQMASWEVEEAADEVG